MRKQGAILVLATFLALILCSAVSAADSSDDGGVLLDQVQDVDGSVLLVDQSSQSVIDPVITLGVNYEYSSDGGINPAIDVKDSAGVGVEFTKTYDSSDKIYSLTFDYPDVADGSTFKVIVSAPGYVTEEQEVAVTAGTDGNFHGQVNFNLEATAAYKLGREVTKKADQLLKFSTADEVLCITTAGLTYLDGATTEDCLEGILNASNGLISYGQGNLLTLRKTRADPVDFAFIIKKGSSLKAVYFKNGSLTPAYQGTFSGSMTQDQWDDIVVPTFGDDAFGYVSLANAWAVGLSTDTLRQAAFHGHVCIGTISGQAMIQTLLKYYPPVTDVGLPLEGVSYQVLGVPGNSDDDAFVYSMDDTPGKRAYVGVDTMVGTNMAGFIRWNSKSNSGTLIIMKFDEQAVVQKYKSETGLTAYAGISAEIKFNKWMVDKLQNDPESMVTIVKELDNLNEEQYHYLMGYEPDKGQTTVQAHGLDMDYINSLDLPTATRQNMQYANGNLSPGQIKQIGVDAANKAIELFKAMGITLEKDDPKLTVLTSAGYVRLNGQTTDMTMDGIYEVLGARLSRATLLPVHSALWKSLVFDFAYENGNEVITKAMHYDTATKQIVVDQKANYSIEGVLLYDPPYDALMAWLWHNHICGGSSPGYLINDYIQDNYPLGEDEKYIYVTTSDSCRDDIYSYLLGTSAGAGTYYNLRFTTEDNKSPTDNGTMVGIIIKWNEKTNIGTAAIIDWTGPKFASGSNSYEEYIKLYWGDITSSNLVSAPLLHVESEKLVTEDELQMILSGGSESANSLQFIMGLPERTLSDLLPNTDGNQDGDQNGNRDGQTDGGSDTSTGDSVGDSGLAMTATLQATATEAGQEPGSTSTAHEITPVTSESTSSSSWGVAAIVGVLVVLALGAFGFFWKGRGSA